MEEFNQPRKKWSKHIAVICGVLALCVVMTAFSGCKSKSSTEPEASVSEDETVSHVDQEEIQSRQSYAYTDESLTEKYNAEIVAQVGDHQLNGAMFQIFYWSAVYSYLSSNSDYIAYLGPDVSTPLSEQDYGENVTWEQHFVEAALEMYLQYVAMYTEAKATGVTLSAESQAALDTLAENLTTQATESGFESGDAYIAESFGAGVTLDDYVEFSTINAYAVTYAQKLESDISVSEAEVEAYYDANAESYSQNGVEKIDQNVVNVRHILIQPIQDEDSDGDGAADSSSEEAWAAAEEQANTIYEQWKQDPTEENFAALAQTESSDPGSAENGGLYENVYPGQMVASFNDWCFDRSRTAGDNAIVKTDYGYHIMYFSGTGDFKYWYMQAESDCIYEKFDKLLEEVFSGYTLDTHYENIHIFDIIAYTAAQNAASADAE